MPSNNDLPWSNHERTRSPTSNWVLVLYSMIPNGRSGARFAELCQRTCRKEEDDVVDVVVVSSLLYELTRITNSNVSNWHTIIYSIEEPGSNGFQNEFGLLARLKIRKTA